MNTNIQEAVEFFRGLEAKSDFPETIDQLHDSIKSALNGYRFQSPLLPANYLFCRARVLDVPFLPHFVDEVSFPPSMAVKKDHRAGRSGESLFYCSDNNSISLRESRAVSGQLVALSYWRNKRPLVLAAVGYSQQTLQYLGARRTFLGWGKPEAQRVYEDTPHGRITEFLASCFTRRVNDSNLTPYRASIAISEMFLKQRIQLAGSIEGRTPLTFDAIMYPSIEGNGNGDNFAIQPSAVKSELEPLRVEVWQVIKRTTTSWEMRLTNTAASIVEDGKILWDAVPLQAWEANTLSGLLKFEYSKDGFITRDALGAIISKTNAV